MKILIVLFCLFSTACFAEETKTESIPEKSSTDSVLELFLNRTSRKFMTSEEKRQLVEGVKYEFGLKDEDLVFIFSVRAARLPFDGFDFFEEPSKLIQLATLYLEAREVWRKDKILTLDFYDFFRTYASDRTKTTENAIEKHFQLNEAKKRFKLPY